MTLDGSVMKVSLATFAKDVQPESSPKYQGGAWLCRAS
jgi:hypothetical protein